MPAAPGKAARAVFYSTLGSVTEIGFSGLHDRMRGRPVRIRTSAWMVPTYALIQPLYEPMHDKLRGRNSLVRGLAYGLGFLAVEYLTAASIAKGTGERAWDHSEARWNVDGHIRLDYIFYWAAAGLALEHLHDSLVASETTR